LLNPECPWLAAKFRNKIFSTKHTFFYCLSSIIKAQSSAENTILLLFTLLASTNVSNYDRAAAVCNAIMVTEIQQLVATTHAVINNSAEE